jgi:threonine synthase
MSNGKELQKNIGFFSAFAIVTAIFSPCSMTPDTLVKSTFPPETNATTFLSSSHFILVTEEEIEHAMKDLMQRAKIITEGAGALPTAAT